MRIQGIEPWSVPWEGTMIPLHQMRMLTIWRNYILYKEKIGYNFHDLGREQKKQKKKEKKKKKEICTRSKEPSRIRNHTHKILE